MATGTGGGGGEERFRAAALDECRTVGWVRGI
jgi:hypothetical protein